MSTIPFTDRELKRAWRELSVAAITSNNLRTNPQRLLLFYAVECGLKAAWLKRKRKTLFDDADIDEIGHDLRCLSKKLCLGAKLSLPKNIQLEPVKPITKGLPEIPRNGSITLLHQAWRYGGQCQNPSDEECEQQLQNILIWIEGELK